MVNWTLVDALTRGEVIVGVAYGSPVRRVAEIFEQVLIDHDEILGDPLPLVFFNDFGESRKTSRSNYREFESTQYYRDRT